MLFIGGTPPSLCLVMFHTSSRRLQFTQRVSAVEAATWEDRVGWWVGAGNNDEHVRSVVCGGYGAPAMGPVICV